jgi:hypothetical protein
MGKNIRSMHFDSHAAYQRRDGMGTKRVVEKLRLRVDKAAQIITYQNGDYDPRCEDSCYSLIIPKES